MTHACLPVLVLLSGALLVGSAQQNVSLSEGIGESHLNAWARHHADAAWPALVLHPRYGLGNRMLSAISALALALVTDRRLLIEWEPPFDGLFESPFPSGWVPTASARWDQRRSRVLDLSASSPSFTRSVRPGAPNCLLLLGAPKCLEPHACLSLTRSIAAELACKGARAVVTDALVVEISSDQYFLPILLLHDDSRTRLAALLGLVPDHKPSEQGRPLDDVELERQLVRLLGRWLLRPVGTVRRAAKAFERQHFAAYAGAAQAGEGSPGGRCTVGIHVRVPMFEFEQQQVPCRVRDCNFLCMAGAKLNLRDKLRCVV